MPAVAERQAGGGGGGEGGAAAAVAGLDDANRGAGAGVMRPGPTESFDLVPLEDGVGENEGAANGAAAGGGGGGGPAAAATYEGAKAPAPGAPAPAPALPERALPPKPPRLNAAQISPRAGSARAVDEHQQPNEGGRGAGSPEPGPAYEASGAAERSRPSLSPKSSPLFNSHGSEKSRYSLKNGGPKDGGRRLGRTTTRMGTVVEVVNVRGGLPLYEWVKASRRLKEQQKFVEGLWFTVMILAFMLVVVDLRRTAIAGETVSAVQDLFVKEEFSRVEGDPALEPIGFAPYFYKAYLDIKTQEEWWLWAFGPLLKGLYDGAAAPAGSSAVLFDSIGLPMNTSQIYVMGGSAGGVVLRTARVEGEACAPSSLGITTECFPSWNQGVVATQPFGSGSSAAFRYRASGLGSDLVGTLLGNLYFDGNYYGEDGYFVDVPANNAGNVSEEELVDLFAGGWLDEATRVVAVEFNVYNPASHVVTACRFFTEFAPSGGVRASYRFYHLNAMMWQGLPPFYYFLVGVFMVLLCSFTYSWLRRLVTASRVWKFLTRWDAFFDLVLLLLFWVVVGRFAALTFSSSVIRESVFVETLGSQVFTAGIFEDAESFHGTDAYCAINLMLATVKLVGYMPFKTTRTIWVTLGGAIKDIVVLGLVVLLFWGGFSVGSHLTFGALGFFEFERIDRTFGTLMVLMFSGSVDFESMREVSFVAAPFFYAVYMIFMWGVMLNLFVAIIVLAYERYSDVQQNFDNWTMKNYQVDHGCMVMVSPEKAYYRARRAWFRLRRHFYSRSDNGQSGASSAVGGGGGGIGGGRSSRSSTLFSRGSSGRGLGAMGGGSSNGCSTPVIEMRRVVVQSNAIVLLGQMKDVMAEPRGSPERESKARELDLPFLRFFREKARQVLWLIAVRKTKAVLENYTDEDDGAFINKWRAEFDYARGSAESAFSMHDYFAWCFSCCAQKVSRLGASDDEAEQALEAGGAGRGSLDTMGGSSTTFNVRGSKQSLDSIRIRKITRLTKLINKEIELVKLKKEIEAVLEATKTLFRRHRISYNRLLSQTWNKTNEGERVQDLHFSDLKELLSPGCAERNTPCKYCDGVDISARVRTLLTNYQQLKKNRQAVYLGTRKNPRRFRLRRSSKSAATEPVPDPSDRATATTATLAPANANANAKARPLSSAFFRGSATPMGARARPWDDALQDNQPPSGGVDSHAADQA